MGMTTFAISNVIFSLTTRDEQRSIFSLEVLEDRMFLYCTGGSLVAIVLGTELGFFHRILNTVHLDLHQWLVCIVVGLAIVPVSEARRLLLQRRGGVTGATGDPQEGVPAVSPMP
jgi:Ca2+-transporting ATPase